MLLIPPLWPRFLVALIGLHLLNGAVNFIFISMFWSERNVILTV